jgi:hypothetical protein
MRVLAGHVGNVPAAIAFGVASVALFDIGSNRVPWTSLTRRFSAERRLTPDG